ncbi:alpha-amylase/4-alpha-glucanotransferase domain-containing protein [Sulfuricurvum sp.]|uniref:alpha-amylase/4-alpha-glucanotransferase domain-containing protein n=1 Tax=Sulfuricurvum sp. TaxID=2025608 RepID=UPI003C54C0DB
MEKTALLFGIHMHQPVDNFGWVVDHAIDVCYRPFFEVMSRYPEFRFSLHCSGWLMEQIEERSPGLYRQIEEMAERGTLELFSAGYYEPVLSAIPSQDRIEQIEKLNRSIVSRFNQTPKGLWLTERVWESSLIPDLNRCKIRYTVMDDYHFQCAGFDEAGLDGYYLSEEGGETIALFPISKKLRYALPFFTVKDAIDAVKSYHRESDSAAIIFDDAEKFGMWPGTYAWVYEKGWLEEFVQAVLADSSIETLQYGEYLARNRSRGIAYLPNVSYFEMGEWSLRADDALALERLKEEMGDERFDLEGIKFLKGGIWKNFFVKYPESNRIHKRMMELSLVRYRLADPVFDTAFFKLQTNDPLWHGVFGGLYLPNLRDNAYRYLIECENLRYKEESRVVSDQNELDGYDKIKGVTPSLIFRFDSACGGQMVEFDLRERCFNWQNTLTRRKEAYHQKLFEIREPQLQTEEKKGIDTIHAAVVHVDETLSDAIVYDWYLKNSFIDHISDASFSLEQFIRCSFREYGDFANQPFSSAVNGKKIVFSREGGLYFPDKSEAFLEKGYLPSEGEMTFDITFRTEAEGEFWYILEHNFHFADYDKVLVNGRALEERGEEGRSNTLEIIDLYLKKRMVFQLDRPFELFYFQLKTLSQSEKGFELTTQGVSLAMALPFQKELMIKGRLEVSDV